MWVGRNKKPDLVVRCEQSWRKFCPNYQFKEWNEDNFDFENAPNYVIQAFKFQKWAFVSDYIRLWALHTYGGIYLDTDVELIKKIDFFLENQAFIGFEDKEHVQTAVIGSTKDNKLIKEFMNYYHHNNFMKDNKIDTTTNVQIISDILHKKGLLRENREQLINNNLRVYPSEYFCPVNFKTGVKVVKNNTHAIHHFSSSWLSTPQKAKVKLSRIFKKIVNFKDD